jgi:pyruvate dehydrogenase E2 component (dihydrolipoamide acetyltransferase)
MEAHTVIEVRLPQTTDEAQDSVIILWYKSEGDVVQEHDVLVEVQTEKATFEVESPATGVLHKILRQRAETASVGDVLALIATEDDRQSQNEEEVAVASLESAPKATKQNGTSGFVQAPPRIRRLAAELGVDLAEITGTGPNGRITEEDVRRAADGSVSKETYQSAHVSFSEGEHATQTHDVVVPLTPTRKTIAHRMMQSLEQSAQLTITTWADVTELSKLRKAMAPDVSWNAWVLKAAVLALMDHPYVNAEWDEHGVRHFAEVHLGVAVDTDAGLLVPVIRNAEKLSLQALHDAAKQAAEKARAGTLTAAELTGGTFTVTNLGSYGVEFFTPILNPPQVGILGVGQVDEKLLLRSGSMVQAFRLPLSLTFDHRAFDGGPAARFLQTITRYLSQPRSLL